MTDTEIDRRNGFGFTYSPAEQSYVPTDVYFPVEAEQLIVDAFRYSSTLITANPGTGKSHLISDIIKTAVKDQHPVLGMAAQINGGAKKGVQNAQFVLDEFARRHGANGLVVIDNIDYYGYSGSRGTRRYPVAQAHLEVVEQLMEFMSDPQAPRLCATAHAPEWRKAHWRFSERRDNDTVTPTAKKLLDSFDVTVEFTGKISEETAARMLPQEVNDSVLQAIRRHAGDLYFRYLNHLPAAMAEADNIDDALAKIDSRTALLIGGTACQA